MFAENVFRLKLSFAEKTSQFSPVHKLGLVQDSRVVFLLPAVTVSTIGSHKTRFVGGCSRSVQFLKKESSQRANNFQTEKAYN